MKVFWSLFTKLNFPSHLFSFASSPSPFSHHKVWNFLLLLRLLLLVACCCCHIPSSLLIDCLEILILMYAPKPTIFHPHNSYLTLLFDKIDDPSSMGLLVALRIFVRVVYACMLYAGWGNEGEKIVVIFIFNVIILVSLSFYGTGSGQIQQWIIDFFPLHFTLDSRKICSGFHVVATKALLQRERERESEWKIFWSG